MSHPGFTQIITRAAMNSTFTPTFLSVSGRVQAQPIPPSGPLGTRDFTAQTSYFVVFDVRQNTPFTLQFNTSYTPDSNFLHDSPSLRFERESPLVTIVNQSFIRQGFRSSSGVLTPGRYHLGFSLLYFNGAPTVPEQGDVTYSVALFIPAPGAAGLLAGVGVLACRRRR